MEWAWNNTFHQLATDRFMEINRGSDSIPSPLTIRYTHNGNCALGDSPCRIHWSLAALQFDNNSIVFERLNNPWTRTTVATRHRRRMDPFFHVLTRKGVGSECIGLATATYPLYSVQQRVNRLMKQPRARTGSISWNRTCVAVVSRSYTATVASLLLKLRLLLLSMAVATGLLD